MYVYKIIDVDVGGIVHEVNCEDHEYFNLVKKITDDLYSYEFDEEYDECDELTRRQLEYWTPSGFSNDLESFSYECGLREYHLWFPGMHRKIVVEYVDVPKKVQL